MRQRHWRIGVGAAVMMVAAAAAIALGSALPSQDVWQADVRVQSIDVSALKRGGPLSVRVVVTSDNDDDALAVRMDLLLPIGVGVLRLAPGCRPSPSAVSGLNARVVCELGDVPVRGLREVSITTTAAAAAGAARFAVFVMSDTPDPVPSNNFAEGVAP